MKILNIDRLKPCSAENASAEEQVDWSSRFSELAAHTRDPRLHDYYRNPPVPADTPISRVPLLSLDIETSGLNDQQDVILSIGFIPFVDGRIRCSEAANWIVQPDGPVADTAVTIHGITHTDLKTAPRFGDYFDALLRAMTGKVIVAHCHQIERQFLSAATLMLTGEALHFPVIDTMAIERRMHSHERPSLLQRWFGKAAYPSLRLDAARTRYGLPSYHPHHALTDALATAELFQAQLQYHYHSQTPVARLWC